MVRGSKTTPNILELFREVMSKRKFLILFVVVLTTLITTKYRDFAWANNRSPDVGNSVYCASILPCNEKGELMPEFNNPDDGCHTYFLNQCEEAKVQLLKENQCTQAIGKVKILRKELAQLKKRFRQFRRKSHQDLR